MRHAPERRARMVGILPDRPCGWRYRTPNLNSIDVPSFKPMP